jgi:hypothetical protein
MNKGYIYKRRMLKLARELEVVEPKRFFFGEWAGDNWGGKANMSCGSTACAFGLATTIPSFRKLGLRMFWLGGRKSGKPWVGLIGDEKQDAPYRAANIIFGLSYMEYCFVFLPQLSFEFNVLNDQKEIFGRESISTSSSAKDVAEHIRFLMKFKYRA